MLAAFRWTHYKVLGYLMCDNKAFVARILVGVAIFWAITVATTVTGSSAAAVAINSKGGLGYGDYHGPEITEAEARRRAINECLNWGGRNPRIIASTSKRGYGAVVWFFTTDKKLDYTAALAARTWDAAVNQAKKQAKSLGGAGFKVIRGWNDAPRDKRQPIIMQKL
jgi:hypothetical protein